MAEMIQNISGTERFGTAIDRLTLMDNIFLMRYFQDNLKGVSFILQKLLNKDDVYAIKVDIEHYIKNVHGRDIRFDVYAEDETGRQYNIEIQRADAGAVPKRARYHSSMMDCAMLEPNEEFHKLVETVVIFITEHDVLRGGKVVYHIDRVIKETGKEFRDEAHIIYVNAEKQDESVIGRLMHDFTCADPKEMYYPEVAEKAYLLKYDQKERGKMAGVMEELIAEERRQERERQSLEKSKEFAQKLLGEEIFPFEKIAELADLSVDEIQRLYENMQTA